MMGMQTAVAFRPYAENLWVYVKPPGQLLATEDRDRAVEYCRRYAQDVKVFKMVNMAISIITHHVRKSSKEVLYYMADFTFNPTYLPSAEGDPVKRVSMWFEVQVETSKGARRKTPEVRYELVLLVNPDGYIVDVDLTRLTGALTKQFLSAYPQVNV